MAAVRLSFTWLGVRKTLAPDQRCPSGKPANSERRERRRARNRCSEHFEFATAVTFGGLKAVAEFEELIVQPAQLHAVDSVAEVAN